jgi:hypothetical protein
MNEDNTEMELQEILLCSSRHGDETMVQELLSARQENKIILDISCKGTSPVKFINFHTPKTDFFNRCHIFLHFYYLTN